MARIAKLRAHIELELPARYAEAHDDCERHRVSMHVSHITYTERIVIIFYKLSPTVARGLFNRARTLDPETGDWRRDKERAVRFVEAHHGSREFTKYGVFHPEELLKAALGDRPIMAVQLTWEEVASLPVKARPEPVQWMG